MQQIFFAGLVMLMTSTGLTSHVERNSLNKVDSTNQQPGVKRTELQRYDLSTPGREVIQSRIDFEPGVAFGNHSHPGEEIIYVIEGTFEYKVEGKPAVTLKAGEVLFIPAGVVHAAKNVGRVNAAELATYVVEKGKTLVVMTK